MDAAFGLVACYVAYRQRLKQTIEDYSFLMLTKGITPCF